VVPVAVVGNLARDVIEGTPPRPGGGPFHCARALRLVRARSVIVARAGDRSLFRPLAALGVPVRRVEGTATSSFSIHYEGETRVMQILEVGDSWEPERAAGLPAGGWVHLAPLARSDFPSETLAAFARGRRLSYDGQGLVRAPRVGPLALDADYDPEVLSHLQVLKLSDEEADVLGDTAGLHVPELLLTHGIHGCTVCVDGTATHVPCNPIDVDPTGAGDAFMAGYIAARAEGRPPLAAARRATSLVADVLAERLLAQSR